LLALQLELIEFGYLIEHPSAERSTHPRRVAQVQHGLCSATEFDPLETRRQKATSPEPANVATELVADSGLPPTSSSFSTTPLLETGYDKNKSTIQSYNTLEKYVEHSRNNDLEESGHRDMNPTQSMMPANKKMRSYKSLDGTYENINNLKIYGSP
jgi:hypothetical protein